MNVSVELEKESPSPESYVFKGWDWTEIGTALGGPAMDCKGCERCHDEYDIHEKEMANFIRNAVLKELEIMGHDDSCENEGVVAATCRRYLVALSEDKSIQGSEAPLWKGLSECDNFTILRYTDMLLESMWS